MANDAVVLFSSANGIATITLNRPEKHNALNNVIIAELMIFFNKAREDKNCRVVILQAIGENFCAGADIAWMQKIAEVPKEDNLADAMQLAALLQLIYVFPKPVIVLAQGAIMGGGLGLISVCDIALVTTDASFSFSEVKLGISPSVVSPYVIAAIGERAARYYFLTGEKFAAEEALRIGLVHQVVAGDAAKNVTVTMANQLLKFSPAALAATKRLIRDVSSQVISKELIELTAKHLVDGRTSVAGREGLAAFLEKRPPEWS